ncbi:MAG: DUF1080 domain-containing protein, partial [Bacteroidota bacterium]|nr:DUF1080 domain-containing protein [Bacteroidota bacterium]
MNRSTILHIGLTSCCLAILLSFPTSFPTRGRVAWASGATARLVPADAARLEGRWDLVVLQGGRSVPSWLEVTHSGLKTLVGRFVGGGGCARPISRVHFDEGKMSFSIPPQWEREDRDLS